MRVQRKARSGGKISSDKEFETLLRRAAAYLRSRKPRRTTRTARKKRRGA